jgi:hypothetical protein
MRALAAGAMVICSKSISIPPRFMESSTLAVADRIFRLPGLVQPAPKRHSPGLAPAV